MGVRLVFALAVLGRAAAQVNPTCTSQPSGCNTNTNGGSGSSEWSVNVGNLDRRRLSGDSKTGTCDYTPSDDDKIEITLTIKESKKTAEDTEKFSCDGEPECEDCPLAAFAAKAIDVCNTVGIITNDLEDLSDDVDPLAPDIPRCCDCSYHENLPFCIGEIDDHLQFVAESVDIEAFFPKGVSECNCPIVQFSSPRDMIFSIEATATIGGIEDDGFLLEDLTNTDISCEDACKEECECVCEEEDYGCGGHCKQKKIRKCKYHGWKSCKKKCPKKCAKDEDYSFDTSDFPVCDLY
mmetsp:Transcript_1999/g.5077  ORF Transcript_1999/g.5077 Transcript_1999/m.5077 type:complete len:294 (+) Transcript_1999:44-925(+)